MTEMNSRPIIQRTVVRQATEPNRPLSGMTWINPTGGQNGNNSETYVWNDDADAWELTRSTGPDTPLNAAAGATWTDTANGTVKNYRAGAWQNVGVTDHANLSNVTASQHHAKPHIERGVTAGSSAIETVSFNSAFAAAPVVTTGAENSSTSGIFAEVYSNSTTSVDLRSWTDAGNTTSAPKTAIAMEDA